jgi:hypothetical protein
MITFAKEFLRDSFGPQQQRRIFLGAFGKHPGWDDHIDDIGLETESMVAAKQLLYIDGIGGQLGPWEKLEWRDQIPFNHVFAWRREAQLLVGRFWASSDGKKRTRYPMVVCAHCIGTSLSLVLDTLLLWFAELQSQASATNSAEDVQAIVALFRDGLRNWISAAEDPMTTEGFDPDSFLADVGYTADDESFLKMLWALHESPFAMANFRARAELTPEHLRVLASSASVSRSLQFWDRMIASHFDPSVPVLLVMPTDQYWLDVIAGEPASRDF